MPVFLLCTCNWGIEELDELPPHLHYMAGRTEDEYGFEKWIPGLLSSGTTGEAEQREFISMDLNWDHSQLEHFVARIRYAE